MNGYPAGVLPRVTLYHLEWRQMRREALRFESFRFHAHRVAPAPHQRQIYVLVIGESSRRADWQLFGYTRATNPRLSKLANLVRLPDFVTTWPESITAIPMILTRRRPKTPWYVPQHEASILRAMEEAGYATYWLSNQQAIGKFDSPVSMYAYEAQHVEWLNHASWMAPNSYDGDLVAPLENVIAGSKQDLFIVLHMMGSHDVYAYRYPKGFRKWGSTPPHGDTQESRVKADSHDKHTVDDLHDSYDNSILYSDYVLSKMIGVLKATGDISALWFESDHGEVLPTPSCRLEGHGIGTTWEYEIPAFVWYSDQYQSAFPARIAALRSNANRRTLSADTFASLVDMAGVTFPGHDPSWSLFSDRWRYHTRWVAADQFTDFDHSRVGGACHRVLPVTPTPGSSGARSSAPETIGP